MSEPELLAYMSGTNDDFDLPRWSTQTLHDNLSSSAQAAQSAAQASYLYAQGPPQSSTNRLPPLQHTNTGSSRQPRINQLLDEDQQYSMSSLPYSSNGQLGRSVSLGGSSGSTSRERRRPHMQDDLEGAFSADGDTGHTTQRQASHGTHASNASQYSGIDESAGGGAQPYQVTFYGSSSHQPKRAHTQHDASTSSRAARSPHRVPTTSATHLDPYSPSQAQYSPATTTSAYPYSPSTEQQRAYVPGAYQSHSQTHSRSHSQVKGELTPPLASYSPQTAVQQSGVYPNSYPMDTSSPAPSSSGNLAVHRSSRQTSVSQPATPLSFNHQSPHMQPQYFAQEHQPMAVEVPPPKRRASGLRRVRDARDLRPRVEQPAGRRMDANGVYLSPIRQLTTNIVETYRICNPQFRYESTHNPRRVLTKPSKPMHNDGYDNEDYDYILYVNDWLGGDDGRKYLILDILGQGTFGQVVKCQNMQTHEVVAVKVVKNKPAYFNQSMMEVTILELLNNQCDPKDEHHILRLHDSFIHKNHLCLVFELLSSNLYELIKQNQFQGLSTQLVKVFTAQLLDALTVLKEARLIHCDLKPENILLKSLQSPQIKVIDFGSACHERQTVYTYIQSRFYRSPEVLLGIPYTAAIDMWSLGCIAVELFLGLPLFPGTSEYNQITRIVDMLGQPPQYMLDMGKQTSQFFDSYVDGYGQKKYKLKSIEQYSREHNTQEQPGKQYFKANTLHDIINQAPMPMFKSSRQAHEVDKEMNNRASFIDFCKGLLNMNPIERWSPQQARLHPFITGEKWTKPWTPAGQSGGNLHVVPSPSSGPDPKRPYGGLVPSQPKGTRAYQDAAAYNQHLAQHQAYTAQAQAASQAAQNVYRNPYLAPQTSQSSSSSASTYQDSSASAASGAAFGPQFTAPTSQSSSHRNLAQESPQGQIAAVNSNVSQYGGSGGGFAAQSQVAPAAPSNTYYSGSRTRSNTINPMMDNIPPALARLQHMNQDVIGGRKALTPVLKRDDPLREWERRQSGKAAAAQPYPQLEFLQQQAELAAAQGLTNWGHSGSLTRYQQQAPTSGLAHSYHPPNSNIVVDDDRREAILSNVRSAARGDTTSNLFGTSTNVIPTPPQAYSSNSTTTGNRYAAAYSQQQQTPTSPFDAMDRRTDIGTLYVPMQPDQYGPYNNQAAGTQQHGTSSRQVAASAQPVPPAFYGAVPPTNNQQRNPFSATDPLQNPQGQGSTKDSRRKSSMDLWTQ